MQADVILKEPPPWMPPLSLSGGARVEGGGGARPPPRTHLIVMERGKDSESKEKNWRDAESQDTKGIKLSRLSG